VRQHACEVIASGTRRCVAAVEERVQHRSHAAALAGLEQRDQMLVVTVHAAVRHEPPQMQEAAAASGA